MIFLSFFGILFLTELYAEKCKKLDDYCNCDSKCIDYGDCCPGHERYNEIGILKAVSSCKLLAKYSYSKLWVVDKCRNNSNNEDLSKLCVKESISETFPIKSYVPVITQNDLIYQNAYCAQCNGETDYQYINISIDCMEKEITSFTEAYNLMKHSPTSCNVLAFIDITKQRYCLNDFVRTCPDIPIIENKTLITMCKTGKENFVSNGSFSFRNKYCCECWNESCFVIQSSFDISAKFSFILDFNQWIDDRKENNTKKNYSNFSTNSTESISAMDYFVFYTSFIFTCVSMVSILFLILLYMTHKMFHNFGGYLTICLGICLWLMNFLTLLTTNDNVTQSSLCCGLAILQHFITLSTFVWMAVYALDLLQTFGIKSTNMGKKKSLKVFCIYCVTGFSCVFIIVGTSTIVEFTAGYNSTISPKYGGNNCWFTNTIGGMIWFFIPVCVLLLWNFVTCIIVFYRLMQTAKECRVVQQNESNSTLWLCIRLTAVFGIGYIFQIIAVLTKLKFLIIVGSLINCLQGCLLTLCFIWAKRVRSVVSDTISSLTGNKPMSNSNSKSQTQNTRITDDVNDNNLQTITKK